MNDIQSKAVRNNILWCKTVSDTHGMKDATTENTWGLLSKAPPYYPEIVIAKKTDVKLEELNYFIENGNVTSVKDSYASVDLKSIGFEILFEAEWIYHNSVTVTRPNSNWRIIRSEEDLNLWTERSGLNDIMNKKLLHINNVKIFIHKKESAGFIANLDEGVVGITNVFSIDSEDKTVWNEIPEVVAKEFPGQLMVGYEQDVDLKAAITAGWKSIGPLRVWVKA